MEPGVVVEPVFVVVSVTLKVPPVKAVAGGFETAVTVRSTVPTSMVT